MSSPEPEGGPYRQSLPQVTTICTRCTHYRYVPSAPRCMATAHTETNLVTGEKVWKDIVECKVRNDGSCKLYNERPSPSALAIWSSTLVSIVILAIGIYVIFIRG